MVDSPVALGIEQRVEGGMLFVEQLADREAVEAQQPVGLVQPVLPQQGRRHVLGQQRIGAHRDISGVKHPLEGVLFV